MPPHFRRSACRLIVAATAAGLYAHPVGAQAPATAATYVVEARYSTTGAWAFPNGRIAPHWAIVDELTIHAGSAALAVGAGPRFEGAGGGIIFLAGPVVASGDWYGGLFVAPSAHLGRFTASGTFEFFFPFERVDAFSWELSHARLFWDLTPRVRLGTILHATQAAGQALRPEAGPSIRVRVGPGLDLIADAAIGLANVPSEGILTLEWER